MSTPTSHSHDLLITGGTVVTDSWMGPADLAVRDGHITAVTAPGHHATSTAETVLDATDRLILPGGVDAHCHVGFTSGAYTTLDDYAQATTAALFGGTTTIVDFAIPRPGQRPLDAIEQQRAKASQGLCDSALHACVVEWDDTTAAQLRDAAEAGIRTVKMFTTYRGESMADEDTILAVMKELAPRGGMVYIHCEANHLIEETQRVRQETGELDSAHHHLTRPELAENAAVAEILAIAEALSTPVYFVHQSTPQAIELVQAARQRGVRAFTETVTHHLTLTNDAYAGPHPENYVCCPPLRTASVVDALRQQAISGAVHTIASDHCCYDTQQKQEMRHDVRAMPNGLPGVETRLPVAFDSFVSSGLMPPTRFVELTAANPARLNGIYPQKGTLQPGADADIVLWNPATRWQLTAEQLHMATDYTPYEGRTLTGRPETVLHRGRIVIDHGNLLDATPRGQHLPAGEITMS